MTYFFFIFKINIKKNITNFNHWCIVRFVQRLFAMVQWTSWCLFHKRIDLYRRKNWTRCWFIPSSELNVISRNEFWRDRKRLKSNGAKSGEYRGCVRTSHPSSNSFWRVIKLVCGLAFSWWNTAPLRLTSSGRFCTIEYSLFFPRLSLLSFSSLFTFPSPLSLLSFLSFKLNKPLAEE